jgi:hypothetical protein
MAQEWQPAGRFFKCSAMRRKEQARVAVPVSRNGKRALPDSRWTQHGAKDGGRNRAHPAGGNEARPVFGGREIRATTVPCTAPGSFRVDAPDSERFC